MSMDCVSPIVDVITRLSDCTTRHVGYIVDLEDKLAALETLMNEVRVQSHDVRRRVYLAEEQQMVPRNEVEEWYENVIQTGFHVKRILHFGYYLLGKRPAFHGGHYPRTQKRWIRSCSIRKVRRRYRLGKKVMRMFDDVMELQRKGRLFEVVADRPSRVRIAEMPVEEIVGSDSMYNRVCSCLLEEQVGIIGLFGMGGVGKTTLLKKVNNDFLKTACDFDLVIWVAVSRPASVEKVQQVLRNRLQIPDELWRNGSSESEKAAEIYKVLKTKKFALMLDDIWERIDLSQVGVPLPNNQNGCKVIFTTRLEDLCGKMGAQRMIKVECLGPEDALALFHSKVGLETLNAHQDIPKLAKVVAEECKGLPLALITIGRAMASMKDPSEWEDAIRELRTFPAEISGMEEELFCRLKFSYDRLHDEDIKSCFEYCSIFPEDYEIENEQLIELWIGEGFVETRYRGFKIIRNLKLACLLESGKSEEHAKMHDVIRDMALWIGCENGKKKNNILVYEGIGLTEADRVGKWKEAQRISLWNSNFEEASTKKLSCPGLRTLFIRDCVGLNSFPSGFFQFMPVIGVLDLSGSRQLTKLPTGIDKLVTLQYLNLSGTRIGELPKNLNKLSKLKCLILDGIRSAPIIPQHLVSSFSSLQLFSMYYCTDFSQEPKALLEELESLEFMNDASIYLNNADSVDKLKSSFKLQRCIRRLCLKDCEGMISLELPSSSVKRMTHLEKLNILKCGQLEEVKINVKEEGSQRCAPASLPKPAFIDGPYFQNLRRLVVHECPRLLNLTWITYAPSIQFLEVSDCPSMDEVIGDATGVAEIEENVGIFPRLTSLHLIELPSLKGIYKQVLPFPSLEEIFVVDCSALKKLPFDSNTATKSLKKIEGERSWWDGLQWEDETIKHTFTSYFVDANW